MMNKHHYLHMDKNQKVATDLEKQLEVAAIVPEAMVEDEAVVEEQFWLQEIHHHPLLLRQFLT